MFRRCEPAEIGAIVGDEYAGPAPDDAFVLVFERVESVDVLIGQLQAVRAAMTIDLPRIPR